MGINQAESMEPVIRDDHGLSVLIRGYARAISKHGIDSSEAKWMREQFVDVPEFSEYIEAFNKLRRILTKDT